MSFSDRLAKFGLTARDARTSVFKATMLLSAIAVWCALTASLAMSSDSPSLKGVAWSVSQGQKDGVTANIYSGIRSALLEIQSSNVGDLKTPLDCSDSADDCSVYVISTKTVQWKDTDCPDFSDGEHCDACDAAADSTWTAAVSGIVTTALSLYTTYSRMYHVDSLDKKVMGITSALTAFSAMLYSIMRYSNDCYGNPPDNIKELAMSFESVLGPGWYLMLLACVCKAFVSLVHLVTPVLVELDQDTLAADLLNEAHRLPAVPKFAPQARTVAARRVAPLQATGKQMAGAAAAGAVALGSMGAPALAGDVGNGEAIFSGNCAACHAGGNNVIAAEKTLKQEALKEYLAGGFSEKSIVYQVTNGKNAMPAFGGRLGDDEIADVAAYVYSTAASDGWD